MTLEDTFNTFNTFNRLPPDDDYTTLTQVSEELIGCSKNILQKELDKYFFFFAVWDEHDKWKNLNIVFYFPIVTEEQFLFFKQYETTNSQVAAIEKNEFLPTLLFPTPHCCIFNFLFFALCTQVRQQARNEHIPVGDTESLIERIKEAEARQSRWGWEDRVGQGTDAVFKYCREIWNFLRVIQPHESDVEAIEQKGFYLTKTSSTWFKEQSGPKFSTKRDMLKLLSGEHKIIRSVNNYFYRIVKPQDYDKLDEILARIDKKQWPHGGVAKCLFACRWRGRVTDLTKFNEAADIDYKKDSSSKFYYYLSRTVACKCGCDSISYLS